VRCSLAAGANQRKVVLQATAAIRGRVLDGESRPVAGIVVRALEAEGPGTPRAAAGFHGKKRGVDAPPTDAAGEFEMRSLAVRARGCSASPSTPRAWPGSSASSWPRARART
jgi:protocatechuate 3,4-dioxygenase beta subunit